MGRVSKLQGVDHADMFDTGHELELDCLTDLISSTMDFEVVPEAVLGLMRSFPNTREVFRASTEGLREVGHLNERAAKAISAAYTFHIHSLHSALYRSPQDEIRCAIRSYCHEKLAQYVLPIIVPFFLRSGRFVFEGPVFSGDFTHVHMLPRELVKTALLKDCDSILLVFGPIGRSKSLSQRDVQVVHDVADAASSLGISLSDSIVLNER